MRGLQHLALRGLRCLAVWGLRYLALLGGNRRTLYGGCGRRRRHLLGRNTLGGHAALVSAVVSCSHDCLSLLSALRCGVNVLASRPLRRLLQVGAGTGTVFDGVAGKF